MRRTKAHQQQNRLGSKTLTALRTTVVDHSATATSAHTGTKTALARAAKFRGTISWLHNK